MRDAARMRAAHLRPLTCTELRIPRVFGPEVSGTVLQCHHVYHSLRYWWVEGSSASMGRQRLVASTSGVGL